LAIPLACAGFAIVGAFGLTVFPESLEGVFYGYSQLWSVIWMLSCLSIAIGVILKRVRNTNLYIWFEYPGLIIAGIFALVYAGALFLLFGFGVAWLSIGAFVGIGLRFSFRWLEVHLLLMESLRDRPHKQRR
jgi:hypothetical protein